MLALNKSGYDLIRHRLICIEVRGLHAGLVQSTVPCMLAFNKYGHGAIRQLTVIAARMKLRQAFRQPCLPSKAVQHSVVV